MESQAGPEAQGNFIYDALLFSYMSIDNKCEQILLIPSA